MKYILSRFFIALILVILVSVPTLAKVQKAKITLKADTKVGDVVVEKGTYEVRFDDQLNELSIVKGRKVIAKSAVQIEPLPRKFPDTAHIVHLENNEPTLTGIIFGGSSQTVILKSTSTTATIKN
jgi:hypothetical protein